MRKSNSLAHVLIEEFTGHLATTWNPPARLLEQTIRYTAFLPNSAVCGESERRSRLIQTIRSKFRLNRNRVQNFLNSAARLKIYFDPIQKREIHRLFDLSSSQQFDEWLRTHELPDGLLKYYDPVTEADVLAHFTDQLVKATINRSDARIGVQDERRASMLSAHFGSWLFNISNPCYVLAYNSGKRNISKSESYANFLKEVHPDGLSRNQGLYVVNVTRELLASRSAERLKNDLCAELTNAYNELSNYTYIAVIFQFPSEIRKHGEVWEVIQDATIFAERLRSEKLKAGYFRPSKIAESTVAHTSATDIESADFETYHYGFLFRDCIVVGEDMVSRDRSQTGIRHVVLLMEKNEADETPIPCPACWSTDVRGNSYPVLGVKSWECQNWLCPERSAFDRGNRFSLSSILRANAVMDSRSYIPDDHLNEWKLDVVGKKGLPEILEMLVRHYSLPDDAITVVGSQKIPRLNLGREIKLKPLLADDAASYQPISFSQFEKSSFFHRYLHTPSRRVEKKVMVRTSNVPSLTVYEGDCISALDKIPNESIDGAVTSPPYYNAREYSKWPNIYCYLYDMKLGAEGVWRALKPGGYYLYNIFDYFDNDNIVAMSALGKRRICLGAYITQMFRHVGFQLQQNIVWHKGQIEGKRNYNQGNRAPYYQLPLNTWEHILVFRKSGGSSSISDFPQVIHCQPVMKWFNGENRHGHTAPFPLGVPQLLCDRLPKGAHVLDPYGGSFTTALACLNSGQKCTLIELHREYCDLGLRRTSDHQRQLGLFA